jgi:hypothetical protein
MVFGFSKLFFIQAILAIASHSQLIDKGNTYVYVIFIFNVPEIGIEN